MNVMMIEYRDTFNRFLVAAALAILTTVALFLIMLRLIGSEPALPDEVATVPIIDIFMTDERGPEEHTETVDKPDKLEPPPELTIIEPQFSRTLDIHVPVANVPLKTDMSRLNHGGANYPVAHLLSSPSYPARALARGIEGWVEVRFNLSAQGTTEDIVILNAHPKGMFERAAMAAVKRWKYQPLLDADGQAKPFMGLTKRVVFEIQK